MEIPYTYGFLDHLQRKMNCAGQGSTFQELGIHINLLKAIHPFLLAICYNGKYVKLEFRSLALPFTVL